MKGLLAFMAALALAVAGPGLGESTSAPYTIDQTGFVISVPTPWTQAQDTAALLAFTTPDGDGALLVQLSRFPQWSFEDFKSELVKASAKNSVTDIQEVVLEDRTWLTHHMKLDVTQVFSATTELEEGYFLSLEFRGLSGKQPEDVFGDEVHTMLLSLAKEPS